MENLREWLISVCAFTIASTVLYLLLPRDRISETVKTVLRFVVLTLVFLPLSYADISFDEYMNAPFFIDEKENTDQVTLFNDLLKIETENVVCEQVEAILCSYYEGMYKIEVDTDILSDRSIHIKQIRIILFSEAKNKTEIQKAMENFFPTCEIVIVQEVKSDFE